MKNDRDNQSNNYFVMGNDDLMDINPVKPVQDESAYGDHYETSARNPDGRKKPIIITAVAVAAAAVIGIGGFTAYKLFNNRAENMENVIFTFADNSVVSGIDISGKTMSQAKRLLEQNADKFIPPITLQIDVDGKSTELHENNFTYTFNIDEVLQQVKSDNENAPSLIDNVPTHYTVSATVTDESIKSNVDKICEQNNFDPKNARVEKFHPYASERFEFTEAQDGITVNADNLSAQIKESFSKDNTMGSTTSKIIADIERKKAKMNASQLKDKLVKLASYETRSSNTENGNHNMRLSLDSCSGSVIEPGATWSFNECTGDSNLTSNGYKSATVILKGKLDEGIGGGICQSSSTIYNAAIRANMKVVERYCHKWASSYVPAGLDATIDYPGLDLKLSNPTDCQMFMECKMVDTTLYCSIWGAKPESYDEIRIHNEQVSSNETSYTVRAWKIFYKNDQEVDRQELPESRYDTDYGVNFTHSDNDSRAFDLDDDDDNDDGDSVETGNNGGGEGGNDGSEGRGRDSSNDNDGGEGDENVGNGGREGRGRDNSNDDNAGGDGDARDSGDRNNRSANPSSHEILQSSQN